MDGEFESENLDTFFDWDDDQFIPTFLQSDASITALQDLNLMENFNFQTEVPPVNPSAVRTKLPLFLLLPFYNKVLFILLYLCFSFKWSHRVATKENNR